MAVIKCKMCGGDLNIIPGESVAECEYCGSRQTVPTADNEKKLTLFARANRLRAGCEFDKAAGVYESIVADFPEEAEAYWGLVLCKYGIEYVDDPATGRKIPTCHRSSFDSILEDSDFDQACENADAVARKVYREEAKQIEELRKGIIAVSANEQPYDIFICYKETDENGDRTLDSVLAQDIYDALTDKGYRVFFSRITLEDKLGTEYEPYIFAALNSAKIMLAVGTDYEYYNAVWVKNEWSRYIKLMASDKSRHLIPCYKGIDAYDMPREFAKLQAQDMGKVGAMQDLLRGIEKLLPKGEPAAPAVREAAPVESAGSGSRIASLLDRGSMALEDGDWEKADSFFEDVLNNDSKNAQAYIGKALAQEKCRSLNALIRKRLDAHQRVASETLYIPERQAHVEEMVGKYTLPGYVEEETIRELYDVDHSYSSEVSGREQQYREEENWWQNHRWLSRAEKFAVGAVANTIQNEKKHLFTQLNDRVKKAEQEDAKTVAQMEQAYDEFLAETDAQAEKLYNDGIARREKDYEVWLEQAKTETNPKFLLDIAEAFDGLGSYQDSEKLAEHCRKRADEEQDKLDEAEARRRIREEQRRKEQQKKAIMIFIVCTVAVVLVVAAEMLVTKVIIPRNAYKEAEVLLENGRYEEAAAAYEALGSYSDSSARYKEACLAKTYQDGTLLLSWGKNRELNNPEAQELLKQTAEKNAKETVPEETKDEATAMAEPEELFALECFRGAEQIFEGLGNYRDSAAMVLAVREEVQDVEDELDRRVEEAHAAAYAQAEGLAHNGDDAKAAISYGRAGDYRDARQRSMKIWDTIAQRESISTGDHMVGLKSDGTVVAVGSNEDGECDVSGWRDIVAVSAGRYHSVGLKSDGTVVAVGDNKDVWGDYVGQCDVSGWRDIVAVSAGSLYTVGLKSDGTVVAVGDNDYGQCDVSGWRDIVAVSAGSLHTVGLKSDGTVVAVGESTFDQFNVRGWRDIVAVSIGDSYTVGLKSDGTVVAVGYNMYGQCNVSGWRDIVAVSAGDGHTVGLKSDGTVVAVGLNDHGECNVRGWTDIVAVSAGRWYTVGLKSDGTVVAVGWNKYGQCNVSDWTDIKMPNNKPQK